MICQAICKSNKQPCHYKVKSGCGVFCGKHKNYNKQVKDEELSLAFESSCSLKDNVDIENDNLCCVCLTREKNMAFVPCGHKCICATCFNKLQPSSQIDRQDIFIIKTCPICKTKGFAIKIYD